MKTKKCLNCSALIEIDTRNLEIGQKIVCPVCAAEHHIIWLFPIEIEYNKLKDDSCEQTNADEEK